MIRPYTLLATSVILGLVSWFLLGQCYRMVIENLKLGSTPWYGRLILPAILVSGFSGAASAYLGLRQLTPPFNSGRIAIRFQVAGCFSVSPSIIIALLRTAA